MPCFSLPLSSAPSRPSSDPVVPAPNWTSGQCLLGGAPALAHHRGVPVEGRDEGRPHVGDLFLVMLLHYLSVRVTYLHQKICYCAAIFLPPHPNQEHRSDVVTFARLAVTVMTSDTRSPSYLDWLTKAQMALTRFPFLRFPFQQEAC